MEITGRIKKIFEPQTFENGFKKRQVVITTIEQYPQDILIEFFKEKCDLLNLYKEGDSVKMGININGREWTSPQGEVKYFNTIIGWKIEKADGVQSKAVTQTITEEKDDLPF